MASLHATLADRHAHTLSICRVQESIPPGPLDLPEILVIIGQFLTLDTLSVCIRVSRTWYDTFISWLWIKVDLTSRSPKPPSVEFVRKHATLIRRLEMDGVHGNAFIHRLTFPNVSSLRIRTNHYVAECNGINEDLQLIDTFPRLQRLEYEGMLMDDPKMWFSQKKETWSRLKTLSLEEPWFRPRRNRGHLTKLSLDEAPVVPEIEDVAFLGRHCYDKEARAKMWMIAQCSNLVRLRWRSSHKSSTDPEALQKLNWIANGAGHYWPSLKSLSLPCQHFLSESFKTLVESITSRLEELDLTLTNFDDHCWTILLENPRHLCTLKILNLTGCNNLHGSCILDMLTSLPNLILFKAGSLENANGSDFSTPWVCHGLEELSLGMAVRDQSICSMLLARLSEMRKLEYLEFYYGSTTKSRLWLTLEHGMGQLATLRNMRRLKGHSIYGEGRRRGGCFRTGPNWRR